MNGKNNSKNEKLRTVMDILKKGSDETTEEYDKINRTKDGNLKILYEYIKEKVLKWDNDIHIDPSPKDYINFKIDGIDNNIVSFGFKEEHMEVAFSFKPKDDENILNQCKLKNKQSVYRMFITSNEKVNIDQQGHPDPKKLILKIIKNKDNETHYDIKKENGKKIEIDNIIKFYIKRHYEFLIHKYNKFVI
ncbi:hypothetical protein MBCUT_02060 [Methanobrevibacter cuticularis]|uniref:Uncharacterized protein n=1 Tax=Methanobrevibacter cuticularis TaxID=47311 RepID=A0A166FCE4_9EURY|nr:hypothetical protein [Methanobrevibacter cuticularis]KZX17531.1 hypothetical protein MBCUT_02060 [Methanobrevibacter cuticularis]